jgi:hypothetical protein
MPTIWGEKVSPYSQQERIAENYQIILKRNEFFRIIYGGNGLNT